MKKIINDLHTFLSSNQGFNHNLQLQFCKTMVGQSEEKSDRLISLLYHIVNTQSQPRLDPIAEFFMEIHKEKVSLNSFREFINFLDPKESKNFSGIFRGLRKKKGWGSKTAALFTKNIYLIHNCFQEESLHIWDDVPDKINHDDILYLPVDAVIQSIFAQTMGTRMAFDDINSLLHQDFNGDEMVIWDDLWFWGFFNQKVVNGKRIYDWNDSKYLALRETDKSEEAIARIKAKSEEFRKIIHKNSFNQSSRYSQVHSSDQEGS